jgi:hypothetical protein
MMPLPARLLVEDWILIAQTRGSLGIVFTPVMLLCMPPTLDLARALQSCSTGGCEGGRTRVQTLESGGGSQTACRPRWPRDLGSGRALLGRLDQQTHSGGDLGDGPLTGQRRGRAYMALGLGAGGLGLALWRENPLEERYAQGLTVGPGRACPSPVYDFEGATTLAALVTAIKSILIDGLSPSAAGCTLIT